MKKKTNIQIPADLRDKLKRKLVGTGQSMTDLITVLLKNYLEKK